MKSYAADISYYIIMNKLPMGWPKGTTNQKIKGSDKKKRLAMD